MTEPRWTKEQRKVIHCLACERGIPIYPIHSVSVPRTPIPPSSALRFNTKRLASKLRKAIP